MIKKTRVKKTRVIRIEPCDYNNYVKPFKDDIYNKVGVMISDGKALKALFKKINKRGDK